jgi:AAA15 family ATPase/GTPase
MTIYSFGFENFFSFEAKTKISFEMDKKSNFNGRSFDSPLSGERLSKVLAVVGANGSGKTNLIKPLAYVLWFMTDSFLVNSNDDNRFIRPHVFSENGLMQFNVEFEAEGFRYRYALLRTVSRVYAEVLEKKATRQWSKVFLRNWNQETESYSVKRNGFGSARMELESVGDGVSLISYAERLKSKSAISICKALRRRSTNISMFGRDTFFGSTDVQEASRFYYVNDIIRSEMTKFLREQDFGLSDVKIESYMHLESDGTTTERLLPWIVHSRGDTTAKLPMVFESNGTQAVYYLLSKILPLLKTGGIMIYDELEANLHPHMIESLIGLFFSERTNPFNAQLIFTTHSIEVMNQLQKSQILLVEKNGCTSEVWKLSDMEGVRSDDNFYAKYMSGAYGAVPKM